MWRAQKWGMVAMFAVFYIIKSDFRQTYRTTFGGI